MSVIIRPGVPDDAEAFTHLHLDCWDDAYTGLIPQEILDARRADIPAQIERRREWLVSGTGQFLVAVADGELVGFANAGPGRDPKPEAGPEVRPDRADDPDLELRAIYVRAAYWGTGLGHALLAEAIGDRDCYLWVLAGNDRAIGFYERHGFAADGQTHDEAEGRHVRMVRRS